MTEYHWVSKGIQAKIIDCLMTSEKHKMRFQDIWEASRESVGSKATFSEQLRKLVDEGWVLRQQYSRKYVEYALNEEKPEVKVFLEFTDGITHVPEGVEKYFDLLYRSPSFLELRNEFCSAGFKRLPAARREEVARRIVRRLFSYYQSVLRNTTMGYLRYGKLGGFIKDSWQRGFEHLSQRWLKELKELFEKEPSLVTKAITDLTPDS